MRAYTPRDATTNSSLILLAAEKAQHRPLIAEAIASALNRKALIKRTKCRNVVKSGGHYSMEKLTIESPVTGQQTLLDFSKGARDVDVPAADFTPEGIARLLKE